MQQPVQQPKRGGCLSVFAGTFAALGVFSFCIIGVCLIGCVGFAVLLAAGQDAQQDKAVEANEGAGTKDNPIEPGAWVVFDGAEIRAVEMVRPANARVEAENMFNPDPAAGAEYVLMKFEVRCKETTCNEFNSGFWLLTPDDTEWGEPFSLTLKDSLEFAGAVQGATMIGWQGFQVPIDTPVDLIAIQWSGVKLYQKPPVSGS